jgi:hypothetical protein
MKMARYLLLVAAVILVGGSVAMADVWNSSGTANVNSTGNFVLNVPWLNTLGGSLVIDNVVVTVSSVGRASFAADNDDPAFSSDATPSLIRTWTLTGPGVATGTQTGTATGSTQTLTADNGDAAAADFTGPDGFSWGLLSYSDGNGTYNPAGGFWGSYGGNGAGNVAFNGNVPVTPGLWGNFLNWSPDPSAYQATVAGGAPNLAVNVNIEYTYHDQGYVPEPSTWALLALGVVGVGFWSRRRKTA